MLHGRSILFWGDPLFELLGPILVKVVFFFVKWYKHMCYFLLPYTYPLHDFFLSQSIFFILSVLLNLSSLFLVDNTLNILKLLRNTLRCQMIHLLQFDSQLLILFSVHRLDVSCRMYHVQFNTVF